MPEDLIRLSVFLKRYPDLVSEGSVRWAIFNRDKNGLAESGAIVKGQNDRWFISPSLFREWLAGERNAA